MVIVLSEKRRWHVTKVRKWWNSTQKYKNKRNSGPQTHNTTRSGWMPWRAFPHIAPTLASEAGVYERFSTKGAAALFFHDHRSAQRATITTLMCLHPFQTFFFFEERFSQRHTVYIVSCYCYVGQFTDIFKEVMYVLRLGGLCKGCSGTEAVTVVTCTDGSTAVYYCTPDKSLRPIRFIWAWHPAGILYPLLSSVLFTLMDWNDKKNTFPTTLTPCGQLPLTRPPKSHQPHIRSKALREKCNAEQMTLTSK